MKAIIYANHSWSERIERFPGIDMTCLQISLLTALLYILDHGWISSNYLHLLASAFTFSYSRFRDMDHFILRQLSQRSREWRRSEAISRSHDGFCCQRCECVGFERGLSRAAEIMWRGRHASHTLDRHDRSRVDVHLITKLPPPLGSLGIMLQNKSGRWR